MKREFEKQKRIFDDFVFILIMIFYVSLVFIVIFGVIFLFTSNSYSIEKDCVDGEQNRNLAGIKCEAIIYCDGFLGFYEVPECSWKDKRLIK